MKDPLDHYKRNWVMRELIACQTEPDRLSKYNISESERLHQDILGNTITHYICSLGLPASLLENCSSPESVELQNKGGLRAIDIALTQELKDKLIAIGDRASGFRG